ncbi:DUF1016 N-terminal domain-containing protein [Rhodococcus sp. MSC1_016]|uniref:DUF1016 N-terminal domain-containing protein n=1 Tax=Rhodococcus sp. MSC1_016 TaxID=2909266 RepID=UPI00202F0522
MLLYWDIGRPILDRQHAEGWGSKVIDPLAADLRSAFPEMCGFPGVTCITCGRSPRRGREAHSSSRIGAAPSNFAHHLPTGNSDLAQNLVRDPYVFDFWI